MQSDDQAFLDQIEQNIKSKDNEQEDAKREAEQRAREMDRIRKASAQTPGAASGGEKTGSTPANKPNELENDPRYKEYFQRLKRQKGESTAPPAAAPAAGAANQPTKAPQPKTGQQITPGAIVRFDDGSIGVYKDAVSGRDYALFYFLHPEGQFEPDGVFLQCYQAKVIGTLPEEHFSSLRDSNIWERDMIVFHLSDYAHVNFLNKLAEHEERKPKKGAPAKAGSVTTAASTTPPAGQQSVAQEAPNAPQQQEPTPPPQTAEPAPQQKLNPEPVPEKQEEPAKEPEGLVKGRRFQIKFSGKQWEAVYWADDPEGSIVAHSTHGHWSLMRLDLERFKDSLELAEIVDSSTLEAIARDAAEAK